jgi:hypothetical protein
VFSGLLQCQGDVINISKGHLRTNSIVFYHPIFFFDIFVILKMNREHNFAWSRDQLTKLLLHGKFENMCFHISKHVLSDIRYRKTCDLTSYFVLGVGGGLLP